MKKLKLIHPLTPPSLIDVNSKLESLLQAEELDDTKLRELVDARDEIILQHLEGLSAEAKQAFAREELIVNDKISEVAKGLLKKSLAQISGLLRGRKAVEKYK